MFSIGRCSKYNNHFFNHLKLLLTQVKLVKQCWSLDFESFDKTKKYMISIKDKGIIIWSRLVNLFYVS